MNTLAFPLLMNPAGIRRLAEWFDTHGLADDLLDDKYADPEVIAANEQHVKDLLRDFIAALPSETVYHEGQGRGVSMGPVRAPEEVMADQHFHERGFFVEVEHPEIGRTLTYPGAQAIYGASPWRIQRPAPHIGEAQRRGLRRPRPLGAGAGRAARGRGAVAGAHRLIPPAGSSRP